MQLFASPTSPYVRKVLVLLREGDLLGRVDVQLVAGTPLEAGTLPVAHNPLGKIPALLLDDGTCLYDSRVITRFLDAQYDLGLYPKGAEIWPLLAREALIDGILDAAVLMAYEMRLRPEPLQFQPWIESQWAKIARGLDALDANLPSGPVSMLHLSLACALGYLDFRHGPRHWRQGRPNLAAWYDDFAQRPSLMATMPC
jgi:glutathione S-transferase